MLLAGLTTPELVGVVSGCVVAGGILFPFFARILARTGLRTTAKSTLEIYEENAKAMSMALDLRKQEIEKLTKDLEAANRLIAQQEKRISAQQTQIETLTETVLQVRAIDQLQQQLAGTEDKIIDAMGEQHAKLAALITDQARRRNA